MDADEQIDMLRAIATDASEDRIRAALRKHPHDLNAAVVALLDNSDLSSVQEKGFIGPLLPGVDPIPEEEQFTRGRGVLNVDNTRLNNSPVAIELTSPSPSSSTIPLAGSIMDDKPNWAVVHQPQASSTQATDNVPYGPAPPPGYFQSQDDELSQAISASLRDSMLNTGNNVPFKELTLLERIRPTPEWPVSIRSRSAQFYHFPPLIHALYYVPQIRDAFRGVRWGIHTTNEFVPPFTEAMGRMEMGIQSDVIFEELIPPRHVDPNAEIAIDIQAMVETLFKPFAAGICQLPPPFKPSLLYSTIAFTGGVGRWPSQDGEANMPVIPVAANVNSPDNDLLTHLHEMTWSRRLESPADVLVFAISHEDGPTPMAAKNTGGPAKKYSLKYPARMYIDPFLAENAEIASIQKGLRGSLELQVRECETRLSILGGGTNGLPLKNIRASIKYFEEIAINDGDEKRREERNWALEALKKSLYRIESEIEGLKERIKHTKEEIAAVYDIKELQKVPYDLRSVLMWDGVYGRSHLYTYVKALDGKWYKTVEATVTEVSEEAVLTDVTGLHLGAGPFLLFYSKTNPPPPDSEYILDSRSSSQEQAEPELQPTKSADASGEQSTSQNETIVTQVPRRTFSILQEEFLQWDFRVRKSVQAINEAFRKELEDAGLVDATGRILSDKEGEERYIWEDTLSRMNLEEEEKNIQYDDDAQALMDEDGEVEQDEVLVPSSAARPFRLKPTTAESFLRAQNQQGEDEWSGSQSKWGTTEPPLNWTDNGDTGRGWDDATEEAADAAGWGTASYQTKPIEVEVTQTRTVEETDEQDSKKA